MFAHLVHLSLERIHQYSLKFVQQVISYRAKKIVSLNSLHIYHFYTGRFSKNISPSINNKTTSSQKTSSSCIQI